ncbi:Bug family tripartite tricarboxylate transporter substrate binding protein [Orrella marina]|uniref:Tripartite tricarboxylate transporter substrate binding protein n=1 Tax=Orrella marina TaxID=2163011 RepID=A0A2R4XKU1_9BURK|nr:tripartite tricarboxylate transporter substrate binding protein [Orrella marina]AWB34420.1 hypothetical protein DBV39_12685 [Orrella marina]
MKNIATAIAVACCLTAGITSAHAADNYPTRPITLIVPYPAGGNADVSVRVLAEALEKELGQSVAVTPSPGAGGVTGTQKMLSSKPDGYTLLVSAQSSITVPTQTRKLSFQWDTPTYIASIAAPTTYIGVDKNNKQIQTFQDFVDLAKAKPGEVSVAIIGRAGLYQTIVLRMSEAADIKLKSLPFNGGPPTVAAVLGGHADSLITDNFNDSLKAIALTGQPSDFYPGVKTLKELGFPNAESGVTYIVAAPNGTPQAVVDKLESALKVAAGSPKYLEVLKSLRWNPLWRDQAETRHAVQTEAMAVKGLVDAGLMNAE